MTGLILVPDKSTLNHDLGHNSTFNHFNGTEHNVESSALSSLRSRAYSCLLKLQNMQTGAKNR